MASGDQRITYMAVDYELLILPRSSTGVFEYKEKEVKSSANERSKSIQKLIRLNNRIPGYLDHTNSSIREIAQYKFKTADYDDESKNCIVFKEIDFRLYEDLWAGKNDEGKTVTKKLISLALVIKKAENEYLLCPQRGASEKVFSMKVSADPKNTGRSIYIQQQGFSEAGGKKKGSVDNPLRLSGKDFNESSCINLEVCVEDSTGVRSGNGLIEIKVLYTYATTRGGVEEKERTIKMPLLLYRNSQIAIEEFKNPAGQKDSDFYVLPRINPTDSQKELIKRLQILNNQVLARNKKLSDFAFVAEDGAYDENLSKNIRNSYEAFKTYEDKEKEGNGVRAGTALYKAGEKWLETHFPYSFDNYGCVTGFTDYIRNSYEGLTFDNVKGLVLDRNFLFGNKSGATLQEVEGLENLYTKVVVPFTENIIAEAEKYVHFPYRWLTRPKNNPNYRRGDFTVKNTTTVLYTDRIGAAVVSLKDNIKNYTGSNNLPVNTIIQFAKGRDEYDSDTQGTHRYQIRQIKVAGYADCNISAWITLTYADKLTCNDRANDENYSDYVEIPASVTNGDDKNALEKYKTQNGIPYYITQEGQYGGKCTLSDFNGLSTIPLNWYRYTLKPNMSNASGIGLDCSGLIINCLLDSKNGLEPWFIDEKNIRRYGISTSGIRYELCRIIPSNIEFNNNKLLQKGDIISSDNHIAFCSQGNINTHISKIEFNNRYFEIIHNYGDEQVYLSRGMTREESKHEDGFFMKTLNGPLRHWGYNLTFEVLLCGRIYLW